MFNAKVLNSQATLNNYIELETLEFVPGEQIDLYVKIINTQLDIRYVFNDGSATAKFIFNKANGETEEVVASFLTDDRSIIYATLSEAVTTDIYGGNFQIEIDVAGDASDIKKAIAVNGLSRQILGDC